VTITKDHYKKRGIALYVMSMLLLSVVLFNVNNPLISMVYGDKGNNMAGKVSSGGDDLGQPLAAQQAGTSSPSFPSPPLSSLSTQVLPSSAGPLTSSQQQNQKSIQHPNNNSLPLPVEGNIGTSILYNSPSQSITAGSGEEPDTDENEANALNKGGEATTQDNNLVIPDDTPFKSDKCDGSLDKFVPNPFLQTTNSPRFIVGDCITVIGKVIWTHYINVDGDANFNVKLDSKYQSLLTPANNSPKFNGGIHVEVVCQGPNTSTDPIKVNQCKDPKYDGPKFKLPSVGTRVQVTGRYVLDVNEGGHSEIHPAYEIIFNPATPPLPPPPPNPSPDTCQKLPISNVAASGSETGNPPSNAIDNNLNTRWSNLGVGSWIQADLGTGQMTTICSIDIAWYNGNQRQNNFVISVSNDGSTFTPVFTGKSTGTTLSPERYNLPANTVGRFVRITVNGNTQNNWASITEIAVNGLAGTTPPPPDTCQKLPISNVAASGSETGNPPSNAIDNNLNTRWSNLGVGSWIQADLGSKSSICSVDIAWYRGNLRQNSFTISVSDDGTTFTNIFSGKSSGTTTSFEKYSMPAGTEARYVRITVNGNTENNWASITEIAVHDSHPAPSMASLSNKRVDISNYHDSPPILMNPEE
jgi:hypothetical protein